MTDRKRTTAIQVRVTEQEKRKLEQEMQAQRMGRTQDKRRERIAAKGRGCPLSD